MERFLVAMACAWVVATAARAAYAEGSRLTVESAAGASVPTEVVDEVRRATQSRVDALATGAAVIRITLDDTGATVDVDGKVRRVAVADWADAAAVRYVVVHVVDLAAPAPAVAAVPLAEPPAPPPPPPVMTVAAVARAAPYRLQVHVAPRFAHGVGATDPAAPGVEVGTTIYERRFLLGASIGWTRGLERGAGTPTQASYDTWPLRLAAGIRRGPIEARASAIYAPYRFAGVSRASGQQLGAGIAVRCHGRLGDGVGWFFEAAADAFAQRAQLEVAGSVVYSMPRLAPSLALGLSWEMP